MEAFLKEIDHFIIKPGKRLLKGGKGHHRGNGLGESLDFYGHHKYVQGDDVRRINWKASVRTEDFYVKDFSEERQLHVHVILDNSKSMDFGTPSKWEAGKIVGAGIGYLTLKQMDTLSLYTVNDHIRPVMQHGRGRTDFYRLMEALSQVKSQGTTNLKEIESIGNLHQGVTFLLSDFFDRQLEGVLDFLRMQGQEVVVIHMLSPSELNPCYEQELKLIDIETGSIRRIEMNDRVREAYKKKVAAFMTQCEAICRSREVKYVPAATDLLPREILARAVGGV